MAHSVPAPPTRVARSWGRGAASQEEAEGQTAKDQGTSKEAMEGPTERGDKAEEQDEEEDEDKDSCCSDNSSNSCGEHSKDKQPTKPPTRSKGEQRESKMWIQTNERRGLQMISPSLVR